MGRSGTAIHASDKDDQRLFFADNGVLTIDTNINEDSSGRFFWKIDSEIRKLYVGGSEDGNQYHVKDYRGGTRWK